MTDSSDRSDDRSLMAKAMSWSAQVTSIAMEMAVPPLIGLWIDRKLGTVMVFLLLGAASGMTLGLFHLVRLAKHLAASGKDDDSSSGCG